MPALLLCPGWEHSGGLLSQAPGSVSSVTLRPVLAQEELASGEGVRGHGCSLDGLGGQRSGAGQGKLLCIDGSQQASSPPNTSTVEKPRQGLKGKQNLGLEGDGL